MHGVWHCIYFRSTLPEKKINKNRLALNTGYCSCLYKNKSHQSFRSAGSFTEKYKCWFFIALLIPFYAVCWYSLDIFVYSIFFLSFTFICVYPFRLHSCNIFYGSYSFRRMFQTIIVWIINNREWDAQEIIVGVDDHDDHLWDIGPTIWLYIWWLRCLQYLLMYCNVAKDGFDDNKNEKKKEIGQCISVSTTNKKKETGQWNSVSTT